MKPENQIEQLQQHAIPDRVLIDRGNGGLARIRIKTDQSMAEIYPHGAHVTGFEKNGEPALLFMSRSSQFAEGQPIRGGVPIVFPWFGPRQGSSMHGFGRLTSWDVCAATVMPGGGVQLRLELPQAVVRGHGLDLRVHYVVTVSDTLTLQLTVANVSPTVPATFECCLHTYFNVGDIGAVSITGLKNGLYLDRLDHSARKVEADDAVRIRSELDRTYLEAPGPVEIHDPSLRRVLRVEKTGSQSTVVWNPWMAKSKAMPDFGDEEYQQMVCVESGNVGDHHVTLEPGHSATLKVVLSSRAI